MNGFFDLLFLVLFGCIFVIIYIVAIVFLKPFRFHKRRKVSTAALKFSYLVYLLVFLVYLYMFIFFKDLASTSDYTNEGLFTLQFALLIFSLLIPNSGILLRRKFKNIRHPYNYFLTIVNVLITIYLVFAIFM
jgi:isoprenylcysteine carboxyl methyltransferase (ICMT) family protein YpbQ